MPIEVTWDDDTQRVIRWRMPPGFGWDEFDAAVDRSVELFNAVTHRVDLLAISEAAILPSPDAMAPFRRSVTQKLANHNGGYLVIVGAGRVVPVLMNVLKTTIPRDQLTFLDVRFYGVEAAARAFLARSARI